MEKVNEVIKENNKEESNFFSYVFNFDEDNKAGILNMLQYTILAIIPVVVVLKLIKHYIPEDDDSKPTLEILIEVIFQLIILFLAIWFIDKMIRFVPTYSGACYFKFNETNFIIPILIVLITMQTKLGAKINLIIERVMEVWGGGSSYSENSKSTPPPKIKVRQPLARTPTHQPSQADSLNDIPSVPKNLSTNNTTMINDLPTDNYSNSTSPQNTMNDSMAFDTEPILAANAVLGSIWGSNY